MSFGYTIDTQLKLMKKKLFRKIIQIYENARLLKQFNSKITLTLQFDCELIDNLAEIATGTVFRTATLF